MRTVNMEEAKNQLPGLVKEALEGQPFVIAEDGKPRFEVTVRAIVEQNPSTLRRIGFMEGQLAIPEDFDTMCQDEIIAMFEGTEE